MEYAFVFHAISIYLYISILFLLSKLKLATEVLHENGSSKQTIYLKSKYHSIGIYCICMYLRTVHNLYLPSRRLKM